MTNSVLGMEKSGNEVEKNPEVPNWIVTFPIIPLKLHGSRNKLSRQTAR